MQAHQEKFIEQVSEMMNELEHSLLIFEKKPEDKLLIEGIFRIMHTIKGSAGMFGYHKIVDLTHRIESVYERIQKDEIKVNERIINNTFAAGDLIMKLLTADEDENKKLSKQYDILTDEISEYLNESFSNQQDEKVEQGFTFYYISFQPEEDIEDRGINLRNIFGKLDELGELKLIPKTNNSPGMYSMQWEIYLYTDTELDEIEDLLMFVDMEATIYELGNANYLQNGFFTDALTAKADSENLHTQEELLALIKLIETAKAEAVTDSKPKNNKLGTALRVDTEKLDDLMRYVSELITLKSEMKLIAWKKKYTEIIELTEKLETISGNIRNTVFDIRLVSVESIRVNIERLIRDTAIALKKEVQFTSEGLDTELDKTIIESIGTPLMHLVRNAIDHGIEDVHTRAKRNKTSHGNLKLCAWHSGSFVSIQLSDDGGGIDREKIRKKAVEKQIISSDAKLTDVEIDNLVFAPGLSTAQTLSEVSGRGVGMDVVKNEILKLRGDISVKSKPGEGTTFTLKLPVSLSIIDTLLVQSGNMYFSVPIADVQMCELTKQEQIQSSRNRYLEIQSDLVPYIYMREIFKTNAALPKIEVAVVINKDGHRGAIVADRVVGEYQAVVKPLGSVFSSREYLSGGSIMADGNIAYIIDTNKLIEHYKNR